MDLNEAEKLARDLLTAHGVGNIQFGWGRGKRLMGICKFRSAHTPRGVVKVPYRIELSKHYAELNSDKVVREVMLHEIAHAKAGHAAGHGPQWQAMARELGIEPNRCGVAEVRPEASVKAWCTDCNGVVFNGHRLPLRVKVCVKHRTRLKWFKNGTLVPLEEMPARYQNEVRYGTIKRQPKPKTLEDFFSF